MSQIFAALKRHAATMPDQIALTDGRQTIRYGELPEQIEALAVRLRGARPRTVALLADNGCDWALADLAALEAGVALVPLPPFFTVSQMAHVVRTAGIDRILTDDPERLAAWLGNAALPPESFGNLSCIRLARSEAAALPDGTRKLTFTSGTTAEPKGVCLGLEEMEAVAESLRVASAAQISDRHLCLLPLATLLENIGGIYTPLLAGATICLPRLAEVGLTGSSGLDARCMASALSAQEATSAIMVPQMLRALVAVGRDGIAMPRTLRFLAVGGGAVSSRLLQEAQALGLPVYEGYGLSECASVVTLNRPGESRVGSAGKPLPHCRLHIAEDGEILVGGATGRGYLGIDAGWDDGRFVATGDIGRLDEEGFLHITGRKKNLFITSFGRNVAPEWVESELMSRPPILQAAVFGEARPFNSAVVVAHPSATPADIDAALRDANTHLPDYARIGAWIAADAPFAAHNGMATANGRWRRNAILAAYGQRIETLYESRTAKE